MPHDALEILLAHGVEDPSAAAPLGDPKRDLRGVVDARLHTAQAGDLAEILAAE